MMSIRVFNATLKAASILVAAGLVVSLVAVPADAATASNSSIRCNSTNDNSQDRRQHAGLDFCTGLVGQSVVVTAKAGRFFYDWGTLWYSNKYHVDVKFTLYIDHIDARGSTKKFTTEIWNATTSTTSAENWMKVFSVSEHGTYRVTLIADVKGMYWTDTDSSIRLVAGADVHYKGE